MEYKKEFNQSKAKLAAGIIIDKYLTEDAENYINMENYIVNEIIAEYEKVCTSTRFELSSNLFDDSVVNVSQILLLYNYLFRLKEVYRNT